MTATVAVGVVSLAKGLWARHTDDGNTANGDGCSSGCITEASRIIETLTHTLGNRTHAATILGISIRALRNKLRDYAANGVSVPPPGAGAAA